MKTPSTMTFDDFLETCQGGSLAQIQQGLPHVNLRQADCKGRTPLIMAACNNENVDVVKALIPGSDVRQTDNEGATALMGATFRAPVEAVRALIIAGSDLRQADNDGRTALMQAIYYGRLDVVKALIPGSDLRQTGMAGRTALIWAAQQASVEVVRAIIAGGDLSHRVHGDSETALGKSGSEMRQTDNDGNTALMWAAHFGLLESVRALIAGSDLSHRANDGETALERAVSQKHWPCVDLLAAHDPDCNQLPWPKKAKAHDLPQWAARRERQAIAGEIGAAQTPQATVAPGAKKRNRL